MNLRIYSRRKIATLGERESKVETGGLLIASDERPAVKMRAMPVFQISSN